MSAELVLVSDRTRLRGRALDDIVRAAVEGGVTMVQLRDKAASHADLLLTGARLRNAIAGRARFFVNGDVDAAVALRADGVHLPEDGAAVADVRARAGRSMLVSRAVHGVDAALRAEREGADLVQAGTLFPTTSKPGAAPLGLEGLRAICAAVRLPVVAIGGITRGNAAAALAAGAAGVAVIGAIFDATDAGAAAAALRATLDEAPAAGRRRIEAQ
ncbi:MAG: thiamine phosphate synthase [Dehalococcoidia bacterium]|nr:thiamine phosphate synthase [Dehalococcoidia bacterium]